MQNIRIASVIFNSQICQKDSNVLRMIKWIKKAKIQGAAIVCFPELCITGYSTQPIMKEHALPLDCDVINKLMSVAKFENIVILAGIAEKDSADKIFATHIVINPDNKIAIYRKLHLAPPELNVFSYGSDIPLFNEYDTKFGIQLCYDAHFPELSSLMALKGSEIIFIPHASPRGTSEQKYKSWLRHLCARAYDNSVFIIACNQIGNNGVGLDFPGVAMVIGPSGDVINYKLSLSEDLLITDLNKKDFYDIRNHRMRFFLPNRRSDLY